MYVYNEYVYACIWAIQRSLYRKINQVILSWETVSAAVATLSISDLILPTDNRLKGRQFVSYFSWYISCSWSHRLDRRLNYTRSNHPFATTNRMRLIACPFHVDIQTFCSSHFSQKIRRLNISSAVLLFPPWWWWKYFSQKIWSDVEGHMISRREWCSVLLCGRSFASVAKDPEIEYFLCGVPLFPVVLLKVFLEVYPEIEFFLCGASFSSMVMLMLFLGENSEVEYFPYGAVRGISQAKYGNFTISKSKSSRII